MSNVILAIISLCGGLAFFLFGMSTMSSSLEKLAGGKLEKTLKKMTSNPIKALVLGMGITVAIQSSSAMTVMLVGLVNSGIMDISQTVGVIMGSNIGTTLTAWILSLTGINSDGNIFLALLKPENFSPIFALVGIFMLMVCKKQKKKDIGTILIGFAILMFGMETMSNAVSPIANSPKFDHLLTAFKNPILSVLFGAVFTGIIQSSAASVGILQALSMTGTVTYGMAIPIIMGQNIGTCVTALISSIGVNRNAKRVTVIHMSFNIIGTVVCLSIFYILNAIFHFDIVNKAIGPFEIAIVHTIFNVVTTLMLLPFSNALVKLAKIIIPDKEGTDKNVILDERLLASPALAVSECRDKTNEMAELAKNSFDDSMKLLFNYDKKTADSVVDMENKLDILQDSLSTYMVQLSQKEMSTADSNQISEMLHTIGDFERIGDHATNMMEIAETVDNSEHKFSQVALDDFRTLFAAITEILSITEKAFVNDDVELAQTVEPLEEVIDKLTIKIKDKHIKRLQSGQCIPELGVSLSDLLINCERVSDHCSNIAVCIIEISESKLNHHDYLNELRAERTPEFIKYYNIYKEKYRIA